MKKFISRLQNFLCNPFHLTWLCFLAIFLCSQDSFAQISPIKPSAPTPLESALFSPNPTEQQDYLNLHNQLRIAGLLTLLSLIPFIITMMTSFTRVLIVFSFLKQALGTQQVPSSQIIIGLSLILTAFIMHPVLDEIQTNALTPYMNKEFANFPEVKMGLKGEDTLLLERTWKPLKKFMLQHTREKDILLFLDLGNIELPENDFIDTPFADGTESAYRIDEIPWYCLTPAFLLSELRTAFMMGFLLFIPFLVIDMVISSVLMSMGMMMLPPVMISAPFKLLLFIMVDGWNLIIQQVVKGFYPQG